ncbi:DUF2827 domain-containing protein [Paraburkholderia antibiotica]|uniref:DUF2827 domain-containing protein n=1 Tax=Paraburkholderia antibiotica TaxID=2728839 RepID=A0A7Y0A0E0_9BURK|nr:DUF2827 domain-containing protein [Paraburkholderia antibiotica]NML34180.1 DUF2827 domain-containing protein [Paraburkholderia antibiotica]
MRIGISILSRAGQNIWQNGLGQNVVFLAQLCQRLPFVESVVLIDVGSEGALPSEAAAVVEGLRVVNQHEATDLVDIVIEAGGNLDSKWLELMRRRGRKVVFYCHAQPYAALVEPAVFDRPAPASRPDRYDEVWLFPKDRSLMPMMRTMHRCPVYEVPFIWHPEFVEARMAEAARHGVHYGYRENGRVPGQGFRVAIFEPNVSVVKCCSIPMLVCDEAWRADPQSVREMHVLNTLHMKDHATMLYLANSLDLVRNHHARFHGRHDIVGFMGQHADAVVSHQWQNDQNYAYLDALYGDYPLVHNSPWLAAAGYYYPGFDAAAGGAQLLRAFREHDALLAGYRERSQAVFDAVNPFAQPNLDAYAQRLLALANHTAAAGEAQ